MMYKAMHRAPAYTGMHPGSVQVPVLKVELGLLAATFQF